MYSAGRRQPGVTRHGERAGHPPDRGAALGIETPEGQEGGLPGTQAVSPTAILLALGAAFDAGKESAAADEAATPTVRSGHWQKMTLEEAVEHLKTWIDQLDDPSQVATLMIHVCGCPRAAVIDGTHIAAELP